MTYHELAQYDTPYELVRLFKQQNFHDDIIDFAHSIDYKIPQKKTPAFISYKENINRVLRYT